VMSAVGLLVSPLAFEVLRSERVAHEDLTAAGFDARFGRLADQAAAQLASAGVPRADLGVRRALDMRYRGQGYEIEVALPDGDGAALAARLPELFARAYATVFAKSFPAEPVEIVAWKLEVVGPTPGRGAEYRLAGSAAASLDAEFVELRRGLCGRQVLAHRDALLATDFVEVEAHREGQSRALAAEQEVALAGAVLDRSRADPWDPGGFDDRHHLRLEEGVAADHRRYFLLHRFARAGDGFVGVVAVVADDQVDLLAIDASGGVDLVDRGFGADLDRFERELGRFDRPHRHDLDRPSVAGVAA